MAGKETDLRKVLLVSDNDNEIENLRDLLTHEGIDFHTANSSAEARLFCEAVAPDLIVVDIEMPDEIGFESIKSVRRTQKNSHIVATTRGNHEDIWPIIGFACGANAYIIGPMTRPKLEDALSKKKLAAISNDKVSMSTYGF